MFSRVVSNFRKKTRKISQNKSLSGSLSQEIIICRRAKNPSIEQEFATNTPSSVCEENLSSTDCDAKESTSRDNEEAG